MENVTMRPEESIAWFVNARIGSIQNDYLSAKGKSRGARKLASLRHSLLMPIGSDADAWLLEFEGLPSALVGSGQEPSAGGSGGSCCYDALCLSSAGPISAHAYSWCRPWDW